MVSIILILVLIAMFFLSMYKHQEYDGHEKGVLIIVLCFVIFFMFMYQKIGHDYYEEKYVVLANEHGIELEATVEQEVLKNYKLKQFEKSLEEN